MLSNNMHSTIATYLGGLKVALNVSSLIKGKRMAYVVSSNSNNKNCVICIHHKTHVVFILQSTTVYKQYDSLSFSVQQHRSMSNIYHVAPITIKSIPEFLVEGALHEYPIPGSSTTSYF